MTCLRFTGAAYNRFTRVQEWFSVEKPGRHHLNKTIKVWSTGNGTNWNFVPPDKIEWEEHSILLRYSQPRCIKLILSGQKHQLKLRNSLQNHWSIIFKSIKVKVKWKTEELLQAIETKEMWLLNATSDAEGLSGQLATLE